MITGHTDLYGVLADPIAQVRAPEVMNAFFAAQDVDAVVVPMWVATGDLAAVWDGLRRLNNLKGLIVTVPHKAAVLDLCDSIGSAARQVGAANVVRRTADGRMVCDMFDGKGFLGGLKGQDYDPRGRRALLVGAGGAASAIGFALAEAGCAALTIANRTEEKAVQLAARVADAYPACDVTVGAPEPAGHDLIVNGTSLGLRSEDPLPVRPEALGPGMMVAEVIMKPETTPLLERAMAAGCAIHQGCYMLDAQIALLADFLGAVPRR